MPAQRASSDTAREQLQARAARARERVVSRIARARVAIIAGVAALTCALALLIQSGAPGSTASAHGSASVTRSVQPLSDGGGASGSTASAPTASSGQGDAVSGGS
jgi:hypothetical protein